MATPPLPTPPSQQDIDREVAALRDVYERSRAEGGPRVDHPARDYPPYRSSLLRHPKRPLVPMRGLSAGTWVEGPGPGPVPVTADPETVELHTPVFGNTDVSPVDHDLTRHHTGEPLGERITVTGRVLDGEGRPVRGQLVELWQANAAGRYAHLRDQHPAPLDPNFTGAGRTLTDDDGGYTFTTIKPGPYPWRNHDNAWRPAHLHFSLFGTAFTQRLVTQMYFPADPLFAHDPILQSVPDEEARRRLVATYEHGLSQPEFSLGFRWDIVLDGPSATWIEEGR